MLAALWRIIAIAVFTLPGVVLLVFGTICLITAFGQDGTKDIFVNVVEGVDE
jgi:hypothetical protein